METLLISSTDNIHHNSGIAFNYLKDHEGITDTFVCDRTIYYDCKGCKACSNTGKCAINDSVSCLKDYYNRIIVISPIYFFDLKGKVSELLDRFYSKSLDGTEIYLILFSGSEGYNSGIECIESRFEHIDSYCGSKTSILQVVTEDLVLSLDEYKDAIEDLLKGEYNEASKEEKG